ncbi:MAG: type II secretion system GspH family protein [Kiritimatiellae bacterium]|nr:type II secretion system GspH family protein [Kiritimatiellia bacterium]MDW8459330.1 type II secretion system protein [Verrucomicrobiota bacterium]
MRRTRSKGTQFYAAARGFTYVEVMVALGIVALLTAVMVQTLSTIRRAETSLDQLERAAHIANELVVDLYIHGTASNVFRRHADDWVFNERLEETGPATSRFKWIIWEIAPTAVPSAAWRVCVAAEATPQLAYFRSTSTPR